MTKFTMTRIDTGDLERLRLHAKNNRRSMVQQLGQFIPPLEGGEDTEAVRPHVNFADKKINPLPKKK